jgi:SPP1 family predicted phage head-tail adaptor
VTYNLPITLIWYNDSTGEWEDKARLHARINKTGGSEYWGSGAYQSKATLTFEVRYAPVVASIFLNTQSYRIRYNGVEYDVDDVDDYLQQHRTLKISGVARGV